MGRYFSRLNMEESDLSRDLQHCTVEIFALYVMFSVLVYTALYTY